MIDVNLHQLELDKTVQVARDFERRGYDVTLRPEPQQLPDFLQEFRPDAIARRNGESVVVEVKTRRSLAEADYLPRLAQAIEGRPGWQLELVVTNPKERRAAGLSDKLDQADLRWRAGEARELLDDGSDVAALLLAWSAAEGALRLLALRNGVVLERDVPDYIVRKLAILGYLDDGQYRTLRTAVDVRNSVVHGYSTPRLSQDLVRQVAALADKLLTSQAAEV